MKILYYNRKVPEVNSTVFSRRATMWPVFILVGRSDSARTSSEGEEELSAVIARRATMRTVFVLVGRSDSGRTSSASERDLSVEMSSYLKLPSVSWVASA